MTQNSASHLDLQPDYGLTTFEVYRDVALKSLHCYYSAEVLSYAWTTAHYDPAWPSWIPRWDINHRPMVARNFPHLYNASKSRPIQFKQDGRSDVLYLKGLQLGTVSQASSVLRLPSLLGVANPWGDNEQIQCTLNSIMSLIDRIHWAAELQAYACYFLPRLAGVTGDCYLALADIWCDLCDCQLAGKENKASKAPVHFYHCDVCSDGNFDICAVCHVELGRWCNDREHTLVLKEAASIWVPLADRLSTQLEAVAHTSDKNEQENVIRREINAMFSCKTFFTTSTGLMGTTSGDVLEGDTVAVIFGSRIPFVLRPHGAAFRLASDCYIDGFMQGEAIDLWKDEKLKEVEFELH